MSPTSLSNDQHGIRINPLSSTHLVLLLVTSPLDYRTSAPVPSTLRLYVLDQEQNLFRMQVRDGSVSFVHHLTISRMMDSPTFLAAKDGVLLLTNVDCQAGAAYDPVDYRQESYAHLYSCTLAAVRSSDGAATPPALGALGTVTADLVANQVLYVTSIPNLRSPQVQLLSAFSLSRDAVLWQRPMTFWAQPLFLGADDGLLFLSVGSGIGDSPGDDGATVFDAVHTSDGSMSWQPAPVFPSTPLGDFLGISVSFVQAEGGGLFIDEEYQNTAMATPTIIALVKLSEATGKPIWKRPDIVAVAVAGDLIYGDHLDPSKSSGETFAAFRTSDGALVQHYPTLVVGVNYTNPGAVPPPVLTADGILYVSGLDPTARYTGYCRVAAIRMTDARLLWDNHTSPCEPPSAFSQLMFRDGVLFWMTYDGGLTAFNAGDGRILWNHAGFDGLVGSILPTHWRDTFAVEVGSNGVVLVNSNHQGPCQHVIFGCDPNDGQFLNALDPLTGRLYWRYPGEQIGSYILVGGT